MVSRSVSPLPSIAVAARNDETGPPDEAETPLVGPSSGGQPGQLGLDLVPFGRHGECDRCR